MARIDGCFSVSGSFLLIHDPTSLDIHLYFQGVLLSLSEPWRPSLFAGTFHTLPTRTLCASHLLLPSMANGALLATRLHSTLAAFIVSTSCANNYTRSSFLANRCCMFLYQCSYMHDGTNFIPYTLVLYMSLISHLCNVV
jgi:hypothetical protein